MMLDDAYLSRTRRVKLGLVATQLIVIHRKHASEGGIPKHIDGHSSLLLFGHHFSIWLLPCLWCMYLCEIWN